MSWDIAKFVELLIVPFFVGIASGAVVVLFGVRSIKDYIRERERKHDIGLLEDFWATAGGSKAFNLVFGGEWTNREGEPEPRFGYAQAYGVSEVLDCLETVFENKAVVRLVVVKRDDPLPAQLFEENLVVFGGEASINDFGVISRALGLPYYQYTLDYKARSFQSADSWTPKEVISSDLKDGQLTADIGTVTRLINPANRNLIVLFNGNYGAGLLGSVLSVTRNSPLLNGIKNTVAAQQLLIKVAGITNNIIDQTHTVESVRPWVEFNVPTGALQRFLSRLPPANKGMQPTAKSGG